MKALARVSRKRPGLLIVRHCPLGHAFSVFGSPDAFPCGRTIPARTVDCLHTHLWRDAKCPRPLSIQRLDHLLYLSCLNCRWPGEDLEYRAWGRLGCWCGSSEGVSTSTQLQGDIHSCWVKAFLALPFGVEPQHP